MSTEILLSAISYTFNDLFNNWGNVKMKFGQAYTHKKEDSLVKLPTDPTIFIGMLRIF